MPVIKTSLFGLGLLSGGILLGGLLVSIRSQSVRFWTHGTRNWTFWLGWTAWIVYVGSLFGVAYLDWWSWYRPSTLLQIARHTLAAISLTKSSKPATTGSNSRSKPTSLTLYAE
ncbi:hypothetical protein [Natronorubrum aibiense]|uniref:hypothetical protein n=1 Tax=Natronorubrum aibiense TaxID=348826 RepID=UPI001878368A|nr:hypothetical protein [Natronorubrum aibiense]